MNKKQKEYEIEILQKKKIGAEISIIVGLLLSFILVGIPLVIFGIYRYNKLNNQLKELKGVE